MNPAPDTRAPSATVPRRAWRAGLAGLAALVLWGACPLVDTTPPPYAGTLWVPGEPPGRYRGANLTCADETTLDAADFARWKSWGINLIRINFNRDDNGLAAPADDDPWQPYARNRARLAAWLGYCNDNQIEVMVALDNLWGDDHLLGSMWWLGGNTPALAHRVALAAAMADWLGRDWPLARWLEPWNEPHPYAPLYTTSFLPRALAAIRSVNRDITVVCMAPADWGQVEGLADWAGVDDARVAYSTHLYTPHTYTHQGINGLPRLAEAWPGQFPEFAGSPAGTWDQAAYAAHAAPIAGMLARSGKRVFVSEFGVVRWAQGSDRYLADVVASLETLGSDWVFHSVAGWNGWNPAFAADAPEGTATVGSMDSAAFAVLAAAWAANLAPVAARPAPGN